MEDVEAASGPHEVRNSRKYVPMHSAITARQNSKLLKEKRCTQNLSIKELFHELDWVFVDMFSVQGFYYIYTPQRLRQY